MNYNCILEVLNSAFPDPSLGRQLILLALVLFNLVGFGMELLGKIIRIPDRYVFPLMGVFLVTFVAMVMEFHNFEDMLVDQKKEIATILADENWVWRQVYNGYVLETPELSEKKVFLDKANWVTREGKYVHLTMEQFSKIESAFQQRGIALRKVHGNVGDTLVQHAVEVAHN